jgi:hypothetical protein
VALGAVPGPRKHGVTGSRVGPVKGEPPVTTSTALLQALVIVVVVALAGPGTVMPDRRAARAVKAHG